MPDKNQIEKFLKTVPLVSSLSDNEINNFIMNSKIIRYTKGECIYRKNTYPHSLIIIISGVINEIVIDENGFETIAKVRKSHDYLGETGILLSQPYISTAVAKTDVELLAIDKHYFHDLVYNNIEINKFIIKTLCERLQKSAERLISFSEFNAEGRIAYILLMMYKELEDNSSKIYITQDSLSHRCGVVRQTVSSMLNNWKKEGIIETHRGYIQIMDKDALVDIFLSNNIV